MFKERKKNGKLKRKILLYISVSIFLSLLLNNGSYAITSNEKIYENDINLKDEEITSLLDKNLSENFDKDFSQKVISLTNPEPQITFNYPKVGYMYIPNLNIESPAPLIGKLGYALVISGSLVIDATTTDVNYVEFKATSIFTQKNYNFIDNNLNDGCLCNFYIPSGLYHIIVYGFDENGNQLVTNSIKIIFIRSRSQREDVGVWIRTEYDGDVSSTKLDLGLLDLQRMFYTGEWKDYAVSLDSFHDTTVFLRFTNDQTIYVDNENVDVAQIEFYVETTCDTSKEYSVSLEARFPFSLLNKKNVMDNKEQNTKKYNSIKNKIYQGEQSLPRDIIEPYFCARIGFSSRKGDMGPKDLESKLLFGRNSILDPIVLRSYINQKNAGTSDVTFFGSINTVDQSGDDVFNRVLSVTFDPLVELQITYIPRNGKTFYRFYEGAGLKTIITFETEIGIEFLNKLKYSITFDPLPSFMKFDVNLFENDNIFEFIYHCDRVHSTTFRLDFYKEDYFVALDFGNVPRSIYFSADLSILNDLTFISDIDLGLSDPIDDCILYISGPKLSVFLLLEDLPTSYSFDTTLDLGVIGDLSASCTINYETSEDIGNATLGVIGNNFAFNFEVENFPKSIELNCEIDAQQHKGDIEFTWESSDNNNPAVTASVTFKKWTLGGSITLGNHYVHLFWDIDVQNGQGNIVFQKSRSESDPTFFNVWVKYGDYDGWKITCGFHLYNNRIELVWDINKDERQGLIQLQRWGGEAICVFTVTIEHQDWYINNELTLRNTMVEFVWDLPTDSNRHTSFSLSRNGDMDIKNDITVIKGSKTILDIYIEIEIANGDDDNWYLEYDYDQDGKIINFEWGDQVIRTVSTFEIMVDLEGVNWAHFTLNGEFDPSSGYKVSLTVNKDICFNIINVVTDTLTIELSFTIKADSYFEIQWFEYNSWAEGEIRFDIDTYSEWNIEVGFGPKQNNVHKYGFKIEVSSQTTLDDNLNWDIFSWPPVNWDYGGPQNINDWTVKILRNYEWYTLIS